MSKTKSGLPALYIPTHWTPEQAFAVFEMVDDLREAIWRGYAMQIQDQYRDQIQPPLPDHPDDPEKPPF